MAIYPSVAFPNTDNRNSNGYVADFTRTSDQAVAYNFDDAILLDIRGFTRAGLSLIADAGSIFSYKILGTFVEKQSNEMVLTDFTDSFTGIVISDDTNVASTSRIFQSIDLVDEANEFMLTALLFQFEQDVASSATLNAQVKTLKKGS